MRSNRLALIVLLVATLAMMAGCGKRQKTQKEQATQQWNAARSNVLAGLARDQFETGNYDKSRKTIDEALKLNPENPQLHILSAKLGIEQGKLESAERELKLAGKLDPRNAEADYLLGVIYQRWQKPKAALECYERANEKNPDELAYVLARAEMIVALDRRPEALELLNDKMVYFEHSAIIRDAAGQLLVAEGRYPEACDMLRQASILATDDLTIREHLALAQYYNRQYREAGDGLVRLTADETYAKRSDLWHALGECQLHNGRFVDARRSFETATQINPALPGGWLSLSKAALACNDLRRADLSLRKALSLDPASSEAHLLLGYVRLRQDNLREAQAAFEKASVLDDSDPISLCMIGYVLEKTGRSDQAVAYYARALKLKPGDELATQLMASVETGE